MAKRVPVVRLGNMGMSHALAYTRIPGFEVVGVCERRVADSQAAASVVQPCRRNRELPGRHQGWIAGGGSRLSC